MDRVNEIVEGVLDYLTDASSIRPNTNPPRPDGLPQPEFWYPREPWSKINSIRSTILDEFGVIRIGWSEPSDVVCVLIMDSTRFPHDLVIGVDSTITQLEFFFSRKGWNTERVTTVTDSTTAICSTVVAGAPS